MQSETNVDLKNKEFFLVLGSLVHYYLYKTSRRRLFKILSIYVPWQI
jgi:hypothetical protein